MHLGRNLIPRTLFQGLANRGWQATLSCGLFLYGFGLWAKNGFCIFTGLFKKGSGICNKDHIKPTKPKILIFALWSFTEKVSIEVKAPVYKNICARVLVQHVLYGRKMEMKQIPVNWKIMKNIVIKSFCRILCNQLKNEIYQLIWRNVYEILDAVKSRMQRNIYIYI